MFALRLTGPLDSWDKTYISALSGLFGLPFCPQEVKEAAYKGLVRPILEYGSSVWDHPVVVFQEELESVQKMQPDSWHEITNMKLAFLNS